jgi:glycosyltransferase involved in cell wall biosynthesis
LAISQFPDCRLILAGDGPMRPQLQAVAKNLSLQNNVIFAGFIADTESVYRALDVFVFPSLAEPLGSSLLAAMAHSLPVVAIASGGVPEIIENGRNGILADAPDHTQLARALCELLRNPEMASRLGASARETISNRFTASLLAENTLREYEHAQSLAHRR